MHTISDYIKKCHNNGFVLTHFLDTTESTTLLKSKIPGLHIYTNGGYEESERIRAIISLSKDEELNFFIDIIEIKPIMKIYDITHRHILGTILSLGIKRELIGDIIVSDDLCYVFVSSNISSFIIENIQVVNKNNVKLSIVKKENFINPIEPTLKRINVKSTRLDAIISRVLNKSRNESIELINKKLVQVNHIETTNNSLNIKINDCISIRHFGRIELLEILNTTKKDRLVILVNIKH